MANSDICFLFNAYSNSGKATSLEHELRYQINERWPDAEFIKTETNETYWMNLQDSLKGTKTVVACGGDGTVHRVGNLALKLGAALGVIPIGSGNDFAHMIEIPSSLPDSIDHLQTSGVRFIDLIKISGDIECFCLNTTGIGLDGLANHYTEIYKPNIGKAGYAAGAIKAVLKRSNIYMSLSIDSEKRAENLLMLTACNGQREGGNFWVAPDAQADDGVIDLLMIKPMKLPLLLVALPMFLIPSSKDFLNIERHQCKKLEISCDNPVHVHVDGEYSNVRIQHLIFQIEASALMVVA